MLVFVFLIWVGVLRFLIPAQRTTFWKIESAGPKAFLFRNREGKPVSTLNARDYLVFHGALC